MVRLNGDTKYPSYNNGYGLKKAVDDLMASGVDLSNGGGFRELQQFQEHLSDYKMIVFDGLNPDRYMFSGNSISAKKLCLRYDRDLDHYSVITNLKEAMPKSYICNGCDTLYDYMHKTDNVCSLCTATPPCTKDEAKYCVTCNRRFLS